MGRGYPAHGMSARRLSIEMRRTSRSFGGPAGGEGDALAADDETEGDGDEAEGVIPESCVIALSCVAGDPLEPPGGVRHDARAAPSASALIPKE